MTSDSNALSERASSSYSTLSSVANDLNLVSDELGKSIAQIDEALRKLNLGVSSWVQIYSSTGSDDSSYWSEELGYAKVGGRWGICIRRVDGDYRNPDDESESRWAFNDAARSLRLAAIDKVPELLESLSKVAADTAKKIQAKLADVQAVAAAVSPKLPTKKRTLLQALGDSKVAVAGMAPTSEYRSLASIGLDAGENALGLAALGVKK